MAYSVAVVIVIVNIGCTKEKVDFGYTWSPPPPPPPVLNTPPQVSAGDNIIVFLPVDSALLSGFATDAENNIDSYKWKQLSGPRQAIIQTPDLLKTKVSKLTKGEYSFELTVIDKGSMSVKDTTNIVVFDTTGTNTMIFKNLEATCWGPECVLPVEISDINIFRSVPFKVFFKAMDTSVWMEVPPSQYVFASNWNGLLIELFGLDDTQKWEVMIVY